MLTELFYNTITHLLQEDGKEIHISDVEEDRSSNTEEGAKRREQQISVLLLQLTAKLVRAMRMVVVLR